MDIENESFRPDMTPEEEDQAISALLRARMEEPDSTDDAYTIEDLEALG